MVVRRPSIVSHLVVLLLLPSVLMLSTQLASVPATASTILAVDTFSRSVADGWGSAETGGAYTLNGNPANFDVAEDAGTVRVPNPGATRTATLAGVSAQDVDMLVRVQSDKVATGGGLDVDLIARRVVAGTEYRFRAHISANGSVSARIMRVVAGRNIQLGKGASVPGMTQTPNTPFWIRAQTTDLNPTTLRIKIWPDGQTEPAAWTYGYSDASASLQTLGAVGVRVYAARNSTNAPVLFTLDDYQVAAIPPLDDPILVGAGDIASCASSGDEATAALLDGIRGTVFTTGDNAYQNGSTANFTNCYKPSWGRHKARTRPTPGNHEYNTLNASGYFNYFGAAAGEPAQGYYSYDLGAWHLIALNSTIAHDTSAPQYQWLAQDLAANTIDCTLAYWHHPRYSSGPHGSDPSMDAIWDLLVQSGVDVVIAGHEHSYERFAPIDGADNRDDSLGIRSFVVGTGGRSHYSVETIQPHSEVRNGDTYGVLQLTLHPFSYDWEFIHEAGTSFADAGTASCH